MAQSTVKVRGSGYLLIAAMVLIVFGSGCSQKRMQPADLPLDDPAALQALVPDDPGQAADMLTVAADGYYFSGRFAEAEAAVDQALLRVPDHGGAMYIAGLLQESAGDWTAARDIYSRADTYSGLDEGLERRMTSRYAAVSREILRDEMQAAAQGPDLTLAPNALVIHRLEPSGTSRADSALALGITDYLTSSFGMVDGLTVIDRTRRTLLEAEIARSQSAAYDPATRLAEHKVGAGLALTGRIGTLPTDDERAAEGVLVTDLISAQGTPDHRGTGRPLELETAKKDLLKDVGKQVVEICESYLGIPLDADVKERLARPPTGSYKAFLAYADGLLLEEEGQYAGAFRQYNQATRFDPGFAAAAAGADRVGGAGPGGAPIAASAELPPKPGDKDFADEALDTVITQSDEISIDRPQDPIQTTIVQTTVRIDIITHQE